MAPLTWRRCPYEEGGCTWQAPQGDPISTTAEAEMYVRSHSTGCFYNPAVMHEIQHRQERAAVETACRWAAKDEARARCWAAEACNWAAEAKARRVAA